MKQRFIILLGVAMLTASMTAPNFARADDPSKSAGGWFTCDDAGTLHFSPGETLTPRSIQITFSLVLSGCSSSDPTLHGGTVDAAVDGVNFSCASGQLENGTATFHWDNGRTSELVWGGAGLVANGTITGGSEFVGEPFEGYVVPHNDDPSGFAAACQSSDGVTELDVSGTDQVGVPVLSGNEHANDPSTAPREGGWAACRIEETANFDPGVTFTSAQSDFTASGTIQDCTSSDPTLQSGTFYASGSATLSCLVNDETQTKAHEEIHWNNGRTTIYDGPYVVGFGPVDVFAGTVTDGSELVGDGQRAPVALTGPDPSRCAGSPGVTEGHITELISFS